MFPTGLVHHHPDGPAPGDTPRSGGASAGGGPCLVLTADAKPRLCRLRWTGDLHERFVDAVAQLDGPERIPIQQCMVILVLEDSLSCCKPRDSEHFFSPCFEHQQLRLEATGVEFNAIKAADNSEMTKVKRV